MKGIEVQVKVSIDQYKEVTIQVFTDSIPQYFEKGALVLQHWGQQRDHIWVRSSAIMLCGKSIDR